MGLHEKGKREGRKRYRSKRRQARGKKEEREGGGEIE